MKAAIFEKQGLENLIDDAEEPKINDRDVLIKVKVTGINPLDHSVVSNAVGVMPMPHISGAETNGTVDKVGNHVENLKQGDRVIIYNRLFDWNCDMCLSGNEMLCRNGGIVGLTSNGGFAEYISIPERNVFKIPEDLGWDMAASLPVTGLTPYHASKEASLKINEYLLVFGASGNTGIIAVQIGKKMGAKVIAVSKDEWVKKDFGADYIITDYDKVVEQVKDITNGKMVDVVLNSLGVSTWNSSFESVGINGRWVAFGGLTGGDVKLNVQSLYSKQIKLIGSTGGTRSQLQELIDLSKELKTRIWKKFKIDNIKEALQALFDKERDGRILLDVS
jgi:D-arabinose 1-dehydrogenase-like Zn-dependent alcohol dehydrogenase